MYRGISLLSHVGKMYANILKKRTAHKVEPLQSEAQMGSERENGAQTLCFLLGT